MIDTEALWKEVAMQTSVTPGCKLEDLQDFLQAQVNAHAQLLTARPMAGEPMTAVLGRSSPPLPFMFRTKTITRHQAAQWMRWIYSAIKRIPQIQQPSDKTIDIHLTRLVVERRPVSSTISPQKTSIETHAAGWEAGLNVWLKGLYGR